MIFEQNTKLGIFSKQYFIFIDKVVQLNWVRKVWFKVIILSQYLKWNEQVIRRGDRRPFYAPAKYVSELRPSDVEAAHLHQQQQQQQQQLHRREMKTRLGTSGSIPWPYNSNKNRPGIKTSQCCVFWPANPYLHMHNYASSVDKPKLETTLRVV